MAVLVGLPIRGERAVHNDAENNVLLTVSIAAYNVEEYLEKALESLVTCNLEGRVEILVIDDGSTDSTLRIAKRYEGEYPDVVSAVSKENGGYGTTINLGLSLARGKYFKQLDGDDWFDGRDFEALLDALERTDSDLVVCNRRLAPQGERVRVDRIIPRSLIGKTITPSEMGYRVGHWHLVVKRTCLTDHPFDLPGNTPYTDQLYTLRCLAHAETILCLDIAPYCYRLGRGGQSVSLENRMKNVGLLHEVNFTGIRFACDTPDIPEANRRCLMGRCGGYYSSLLKTYMLFPASREYLDTIRSMDARVEREWPMIFKAAAEHSGRVRLMRLFNYAGYWIVKAIGVDNWA